MSRDPEADELVRCAEILRDRGDSREQALRWLVFVFAHGISRRSRWAMALRLLRPVKVTGPYWRFRYWLRRVRRVVTVR